MYFEIGQFFSRFFNLFAWHQDVFGGYLKTHRLVSNTPEMNRSRAVRKSRYQFFIQLQKLEKLERFENCPNLAILHILEWRFLIPPHSEQKLQLDSRRLVS